MSFLEQLISGRKSIFDVVKEAEGDEESDTAAAEINGDENDEAPAPEDSGETSGEDDYGSDDELDVDTTLDDNEEDQGTDNLEENPDSDNSSDLDSSGDNSSSEDEEPVKANTDIFSNLTAEEQVIKIKKLKEQYGELYTSIDDLLEKINDTETDESDIEVISRISMTLRELKQYVEDYINNIFAYKSYLENDIAFNRFLSILNSTREIIEDFNTEKAKNAE